MLIVVVKNVWNIGNHLFLTNHSVLKENSAVADAVWEQILDGFFWFWDDFDMNVPKWGLIFVFTGGFEDGRNVGYVIGIGLCFFLLFGGFREWECIDVDVFIVLFNATEGLIDEHVAGIHDFHLCFSFYDSEGDDCCFIWFDVD